MRAKDRIRNFAMIGVTSVMVVGCGAPDIAAMKPTVTKHVAAIIDVNHAPFFPRDISSAGNAGTTMYETFQTSGAQVNQQVDAVLKHKGIQLCVIAVADARTYSSDISRLAKKYDAVHFQIITDVTPSFSMPNVATVSLNQNATAYGIGYLTGIYLSGGGLAQGVSNASSTGTNSTVNSTYVAQGPQPILGYVPSTAPKVEQEAFFAGLYTADPVAQVISMVPLNGTALPPIYPTASVVVLSGQPSQADITAIRSQTSSFMTFGTTVAGIAPMISVGHIDGTRVLETVTNQAKGQWQARDEQVVDASSIAVQSGLLQGQVSRAWTTLQPTIAANSGLWRMQYVSLPKNVKTTLSALFGLSASGS